MVQWYRIAMARDSHAYLFLIALGYSPVPVPRLLTGVASFMEHRLSGAQAQKLHSTGLVAPWDMESSRTRVPCIGKHIFNHCTTREVPLLIPDINAVHLLQVMS